MTLAHSPRVPPNREELMAKCPEHGHLPYNDLTRKPKGRRIAEGD